jgi:hypothetical protein
VVIKYIDGHNWRWIDELTPMVSIDTFGLIFIDVIGPSFKDYFYFGSIVSIIDHKAFSNRWPLIHQYRLNRYYRSIDQTVKKFAKFLTFFAMAMKKCPTSSKKTILIVIK